MTSSRNSCPLAVSPVSEREGGEGGIGTKLSHGVIALVATLNDVIPNLVSSCSKSRETDRQTDRQRQRQRDRDRQRETHRERDREREREVVGRWGGGGDTGHPAFNWAIVLATFNDVILNLVCYYVR